MMDEITVIYVLPSARIVEIVVDISTLDSTCDDKLESDQELWAVNDWRVDGDDDFCDVDQYDLDNIDDAELLVLCVEAYNRGQ